MATRQPCRSISATGATPDFNPKFELVLTAMVFTPVSYVAPTRELSILFAALLGAHALKEGDATRRTIAAFGMVLGVSGLALG